MRIMSHEIDRGVQIVQHMIIAVLLAACMCAHEEEHTIFEEGTRGSVEADAPSHRGRAGGKCTTLMFHSRLVVSYQYHNITHA